MVHLAPGSVEPSMDKPWGMMRAAIRCLRLPVHQLSKVSTTGMCFRYALATALQSESIHLNTRWRRVLFGPKELLQTLPTVLLTWGEACSDRLTRIGMEPQNEWAECTMSTEATSGCCPRASAQAKNIRQARSKKDDSMALRTHEARSLLSVPRSKRRRNVAPIRCHA